jgi:hypothetical protein
MGFGPTFRFGNPFFLQPAVDELFWRTQVKDNVSMVKGKHTPKALGVGSLEHSGLSPDSSPAGTSLTASRFFHARRQWVLDLDRLRLGAAMGRMSMSPASVPRSHHGGPLLPAARCDQRTDDRCYWRLKHQE